MGAHPPKRVFAPTGRNRFPCPPTTCRSCFMGAREGGWWGSEARLRGHHRRQECRRSVGWATLLSPLQHGSAPTKTSFGADGKKQLFRPTNDLQKLFLESLSDFRGIPLVFLNFRPSNLSDPPRKCRISDSVASAFLKNSQSDRLLSGGGARYGSVRQRRHYGGGRTGTRRKCQQQTEETREPECSHLVKRAHPRGRRQNVGASRLGRLQRIRACSRSPRSRFFGCHSPTVTQDSSGLMCTG